jgi:hypothetical protein
MRYVIYILVVANCLFFAWHMTGDVSEAGLVRSLPPLPAGVDSLTTLQEREPGAGSMEVSGIEEQTLLQPPGAGAPLSCHALGPFVLEKEMRTATARLRELGFDPRARSSEVQKQTGYWVYLPTLGYKQALQVVEVLKENSIEDYFIGAEDFVSLGIYRELASANRHRERIRELGLEPLIEPRYSTRTVHWLDLENVERSAGQEILKEYPEVRSQELACR